RHDGYVAEFGILHERRWRLSGSPVRLEGEDAFRREGKRARARPHPVAVRFHLHTAVAAQPQEDGSVTLGLPTGERWRFTAEGATLTIEESVY
ncbi:heparinase II/III family protein, partial [Acinetobacter baumannii]